MSISFLANPVPAPELHGTHFWVAYFMLAAFPTYPSEACWQQLSLLLTMPRPLLSFSVFLFSRSFNFEVLLQLLSILGEACNPSPQKFISRGGSESRSFVAVHLHQPRTSHFLLIPPRSHQKTTLSCSTSRKGLGVGAMRMAPTGSRV